MLHRLLTLARCLDARPIVVVSHDGYEEISASLAGTPLGARLVIQRSGWGMGHAVLDALQWVDSGDDILVVWGDMPVVRYSTAASSLMMHRAFRANLSATVPTVNRRDPYVALDRDRLGGLYKVRESRKGHPIPPVGESDCGMFVCRPTALRRALERASEGASSSEEEPLELDFLPCLMEMQNEAPVLCARIGTHFESVGINTPGDLEAVNHYYRWGTPCF